MRRVFVGLLLTFFVGACFGEAAPQKPTRVLFVGNSLIAQSALPERLERLAKRLGRNVVAAGETHDDYSLEDHWRDGHVQARLREGWDYVVLQQGPSARPEGRRTLIRDTKRFSEAARAAGAKPALFSAWPAQSNADDFHEAIRSARMAAEESGAILIPAAETWLRALGADPRMRLYRDELHPAPQGSDLALLATWFALFPAGPQEFDEAYATKIGEEVRLQGRRRDALLDAATRALDEPMVLK